MKKYTAITVVTIAIMMFGFAMQGLAQSVDRMRVDIPFAFYVAGERLAPGRYEFAPASRHAYPAPIVVRAVAGTERRSVIVRTLAGEPVRSDNNLTVRFNRYGMVHYLSGVSYAPGNIALRLTPSQGEKDLAKRFQQSVPVLVRSTVATGN